LRRYFIFTTFESKSDGSSDWSGEWSDEGGGVRVCVRERSRESEGGEREEQDCDRKHIFSRIFGPNYYMSFGG